MFDIGFLELMVVAVIGLLVIGPEKLPEAIKTCALWIGRIKRTLRDARSEFEQQIGADEIRREIHNEQVLKSLRKLKEQRDEIEQQIRHAATPEEEKYEDMHLVQQPEDTHQPLPDLDAVSEGPKPVHDTKSTDTTTTTESNNNDSGEDLNKQHGA